IKVACKLHRVRKRLFAMVERVLNAVAQRMADAEHELRPKRAADGIASQRKRQSCHLEPPLAEIHDAMQSGFRVSQLPFMNDQPCFVLAFEHQRNDLVEGNDLYFDSRDEEF